MAKLFLGILSVILVVVGLFINTPLDSLFDFICFAAIVASGSYCLLTWRSPDALRSDNIRNIRPPKYAPGDKRGKNARR